MELETVNQMMTQGVPFNRVLNLRVVAVEPERAEVLLPEAPERLNHVGTVHAAALFGLGEASSGAIVLAAFGASQTDGIVPLAASASITYRKPARGELRGVASLDQATQQRVRSDMQSNGKARFSVPVEIRDADGTVVAEMVVEWALVKPR